MRKRKWAGRYRYRINIIDLSRLSMHFPPLNLVAGKKDPYCCTSREAIDNETNHPERIRYAKETDTNNSTKELYTVARTKACMPRQIKANRFLCYSTIFSPSLSLITMLSAFCGFIPADDVVSRFTFSRFSGGSVITGRQDIGPFSYQAQASRP